MLLHLQLQQTISVINLSTSQTWGERERERDRDRETERDKDITTGTLLVSIQLRSHQSITIIKLFPSRMATWKTINHVQLKLKNTTTTKPGFTHLLLSNTTNNNAIVSITSLSLPVCLSLYCVWLACSCVGVRYDQFSENH